MKKPLNFLVVLISLILLNTNSFSQNLPEVTTKMNEDQITQSLLIGLQSCNKGLCASCTYLLGKFHCKKSVIPLMALLNNAACEEIRILAALSLIKIGDGRGVYAVKRSGIFDESERVRRLCILFYKAFLAGKVSDPADIKDFPISKEKMIADKKN